MKKIYIHIYACHRRRLDANRIKTYLICNGCRIVDRPKDSDIILYIACGLFQIDTQYSFKEIKEFQKYDAELIVGGCLPDIEKENLQKIFKGKTLPTINLEQIDNIFPEHKIKFKKIPDENTLFMNYFEFLYEKNTFSIIKCIRKFKWIRDIQKIIRDYILKNILLGKSVFDNIVKPSYHIRISWGCSGNCSFCAGKNAVGPIKSKSLKQCIMEFHKGLEQGYREFQLSGEDIGAYGIDNGSSLPILLDELTKFHEDYNITLYSVNSQWIIKYQNRLEEILQRKKIRAIGIVIQSGSPRILKLMNRYSNVEKMKEICLWIKESFPFISLSTEIIVGFPTETEKEFKSTLEFLSDISFYVGRVNGFSLRPRTEAEKLNPKIPDREIIQRVEISKQFLENLGYKTFGEPKEKYINFYKKNITN